ncbi:hypothetical protein HDV62DRAFT_248299 [Trichoderma sp. SZMC 28011]
MGKKNAPLILPFTHAHHQALTFCHPTQQHQSHLYSTSIRPGCSAPHSLLNHCVSRLWFCLTLCGVRYRHAPSHGLSGISPFSINFTTTTSASASATQQQYKSGLNQRETWRKKCSAAPPSSATPLLHWHHVRVISIFRCTTEGFVEALSASCGADTPLRQKTCRLEVHTSWPIFPLANQLIPAFGGVSS